MRHTPTLTVSCAHMRTYLVLQLGDAIGLYCCLDRTRKALLWRHFLLLGLDTSDTFIWKEKLINYQQVAGYQRVLGLSERVWLGLVQQPDSEGRVGH
jgi:hypothetical protein